MAGFEVFRLNESANYREYLAGSADQMG